MPIELVRLPSWWVHPDIEACLKNIQARTGATTMVAALRVAARLTSDFVDHQAADPERRVCILDQDGGVVHEVDYVIAV